MELNSLLKGLPETVGPFLRTALVLMHHIAQVWEFSDCCRLCILALTLSGHDVSGLLLSCKPATDSCQNLNASLILHRATSRLRKLI